MRLPHTRLGRSRRTVLRRWRRRNGGRRQHPVHRWRGTRRRVFVRRRACQGGIRTRWSGDLLGTVHRRRRAPHRDLERRPLRHGARPGCPRRSALGRRGLRSWDRPLDGERGGPARRYPPDGWRARWAHGHFGPTGRLRRAHPGRTVASVLRRRPRIRAWGGRRAQRLRPARELTPRWPLRGWRRCRADIRGQAHGGGGHIRPHARPLRRRRHPAAIGLNGRLLPCE